MNANSSNDIEPASTGYCRDCMTPVAKGMSRCPSCHRPRVLHHPELHELSIAHLDCDAFYAAVEKRDNPDLKDKPVIIGGGKRGVVSTACYIARTRGVGSAMPMFKALKACPDAIVVKPNMEKYAKAGQQVRALMRDLTPLVEPLSIDEAFLDLSGTQKLHHAPPALTMLNLVSRIEKEVGITVSVGLSFNKFLAKIASDLNKPKGFSVIGRSEAMDFLGDKPVSIIWGVGKAFNAKLKRDGITLVRHIRNQDENSLIARYGSMGQRLWRLAHCEDARSIKSRSGAKSISAETTFFDDIASSDELKAKLWPLCERVAQRAKKAETAGSTVTLKLKTSDFKSRTRSRTLANPTLLADVIYTTALPLLEPEIDGTAFRLMGVGISSLRDADLADPADLLDPSATRRAEAERAMDSVRAKFGDDAIKKGRGFKP
jgi:DNA polymerase IV